MFIQLVAAAALTLATPTPADTPEPEPTTYYQLPAEDAADPVADCLLALGWSGRAGDGMAAIYAPTPVIRSCGGVPSGWESV